MGDVIIIEGTGRFKGTNEKLCNSIEALLDLNDEGAVSHRVPGMAVTLLEAALERLSAQTPEPATQQPRADVVEDWLRGDWYEKWQDATENADDDLMATLDALRGRVEQTILLALRTQAPASDEVRELIDNFKWRAGQCRTNPDAFNETAASVWENAAKALEDKLC